MSATVTELRADPTMQELADLVAGGSCVWMIGAGLSLDAEMPSVSELTMTVLENAFRNGVGPWTATQRVELWERLKQRLLGREYAKVSPLEKQETLDGVAAELEIIRLERGWPTPLWRVALNDLAKVTYLLYEQAGNNDAAYLVLARLMGFEPDANGNAAIWDRPPGLSHHLLALLIREGRITNLITTNYDQLVEEACAAVGVNLPVIANRQDQHRYARNPPVESARYYKIHGCRGWYLSARKDPDELIRAARALVVTDRQLQHWRGEGWARDQVVVSMRERPVLFVGYSASEPVLIATLNAVREEVKDLPPGKLYSVAPSVPFNIYEYVATGGGGEIDPLHPPGAVEAKGREFLSALYPLVMGRYYYREALHAPGTLWAEARDLWLCPDEPLLATARKRASQLLREWAESVGIDLVTEPVPMPLPASPIAVMSGSLLSKARRYTPLDDRRDEYRELVRLFGLMVAHNFSTTRQIDRLLGRHDTATSPTLVLSEGSRVVHAVFLPRLSGGAGRLLGELESYFERRSRVERRGTFAIIADYDLDEERAGRLFEALAGMYGAQFRIQLWTRTGVYLSKGMTADE